MPKIRFRQASEAPLIRCHVRLPNGELHTLTVSASFQIPATTIGDPLYQADLSKALTGMLVSRRIQVVQIEHVASVSLEVGL
jgi:hypothetical protein